MSSSIITNLIVLLLAIIIGANLSSHEYGGVVREQQKVIVDAIQHHLGFIHAFSISLVVGATFWVTSTGIVMFKNLPRHQFGRLQSKLFPLYFIVLSFGMSIALLTFIWSKQAQHGSSASGNNSISGLLHASLNKWDRVAHVQLLAMVVSLLSSILNMVYFEPKTTSLMFLRHQVEKSMNIGEEVGVPTSEIVKQSGKKISNELKSLNKRFGAAHGISSLLNVIHLGAVLVHMWYWGKRIQL